MQGIAAFAGTVKAGSFAAAGRMLGLSASAVGKAVGRLEARLSVKLLQRTTRSIALTGDGEILYARSCKILDDVRDAEAAISRARTIPKGRLKVSLPTVVGRRFILPALPSFLKKYPEVDLDLWFDDRKVEVVEEGYDLVLRMGDLEESRLIARKIGPHRFVTCAAPAYLAANGVPKTPAELADHRCIRFRFPTTGRAEQWAFKGERVISMRKRGMTFNDNEAVAVAACAGMGIIQQPTYLVFNEISSGKLQVILGDYTKDRGDIWLVWPSSSSKVPRVRVFAEFVTSALGVLTKP
jgi:DNA-binding transcriptional LysR family regulator